MNFILIFALLSFSVAKVSSKIGYSYIGCYADMEIRDFDYEYMDANLDNKLCFNKCYQRRNFYFGTQFGIQCFCGDSFGKYGRSTACGMSCSGNSSEICGGFFYNSIYRIIYDEFSIIGYWKAILYEPYHFSLDFQDLTAAFFNVLIDYQDDSIEYFIETNFFELDNTFYSTGSKNISINITNLNTAIRHYIYVFNNDLVMKLSESKYIGCYENLSDFTKIFTSFLMFPDMCHQICSQSFYNYSALTKGNECYCGYNLESISNSKNCNMLCFGNLTLICGGFYSFDLYELKYNETIQNNYQIIQESMNLVTNIPSSEYHTTQELTTNVITNISTYQYLSTESTTIETTRTFKNQDFTTNTFTNISSAQNYLTETTTNLITNISSSEYQTTKLEQKINIQTTQELTTNLLTNIPSYKYLSTESTLIGINETFFKNEMEISFFSNLDVILKIENIEQFLTLLNKNLDLTECLLNCSNNGICKLNSNNEYKCFCFDNYYGPKCLPIINLCNLNPCLNNGKCFISNNSNNDYICNCTNNYYGKSCELIRDDLCSNKTCSSNGYCYFNESIQQTECKCFNSYFGLNCEFETVYIRFVKAVVRISSIIAIITITITYSLCILNDLTNIFIKKSEKKSTKKNKPKIKKSKKKQKN